MTHNPCPICSYKSRQCDWTRIMGHPVCLLCAKIYSWHLMSIICEDMPMRNKAAFVGDRGLGKDMSYFRREAQPSSSLFVRRPPPHIIASFLNAYSFFQSHKFDFWAWSFFGALKSCSDYQAPSADYFVSRIKKNRRNSVFFRSLTTCFIRSFLFRMFVVLSNVQGVH